MVKQHLSFLCSYSYSSCTPSIHTHTLLSLLILFTVSFSAFVTVLSCACEFFCSLPLPLFVLNINGAPPFSSSRSFPHRRRGREWGRSKMRKRLFSRYRPASRGRQKRKRALPVSLNGWSGGHSLRQSIKKRNFLSSHAFPHCEKVFRYKP